MKSKTLSYVLVCLFIIAIVLFIFTRTSGPQDVKVAILIPLSQQQADSILGGKWEINSNYTLFYQHFSNGKHFVVYLNSTGFNVTNYTIPAIPFDSPYDALYSPLSIMLIYGYNGSLETLSENNSEVLVLAIIYLNSTQSKSVNYSLSLSNVSITGEYNGYTYIYSNNSYELNQNIYYNELYPESEIAFIHGNKIVMIITSGFTQSPQQMLKIFSYMVQNETEINAKVFSS